VLQIPEGQAAAARSPGGKTTPRAGSIIQRGAWRLVLQEVEAAPTPSITASTRPRWTAIQPLLLGWLSPDQGGCGRLSHWYERDGGETVLSRLSGRNGGADAQAIRSGIAAADGPQSLSRTASVEP